MGTTTITFNNEHMLSTMYLGGKEVIDQQDYNLPFLVKHDEVHGKGKPADEGGQFFTTPLSFDEHSTTTQLSTGYELVNLTVNSGGVPARDDWGFWVRPVVIAEREQMLNRGASKIYDLAQERGRKTMAGFRRELHRRTWGHGVTAMTDLNNLNGIDNSDGFFENAATGAQTNLWHNVDRTTYATSLGWQHQHYDCAGAASSALILAMDSVQIDAQSLLDSGERAGGTERWCWYASLQAFKYLKRVLRPYERLARADKKDLGSLELEWNGTPIVMNRDMPVSGANTTADPISMALVDHAWVRHRYQTGYAFQQEARPSPTDQLVGVSIIKLSCQLEAQFHGTSGVIIDAETW